MLCKAIAPANLLESGGGGWVEGLRKGVSEADLGEEAKVMAETGFLN
ncbi:hypothetical protein H4N54_24435 [Limnospira fusiformis KN01]|uniref:Uncharacterized protein n=1 Tax=Limnospira fusiformis PMC 851.14 TaxID=2219512 RepID=A0ABU9ENF3_LIMFS|nr:MULTISPECIES: hypothetical protein [Limnospira]MDT9191069.1 hypothetical protein [Limnospira sp. PMC 894.15]MDT9236980.1 hypothetical protein [Limnospira sp. PMC 917.15]MDT9277806.1 hypothetical protein [Limnospira sp. PMC 737.11]ULB45499.1 hypothetical protein H4N54_24435 [Limnospira fusiformis KN01]